MIDLNKQPSREMRRWLDRSRIEHVRYYDDEQVVATNIVQIVGESEGKVSLRILIDINGVHEGTQHLFGCTLPADLLLSRPTEKAGGQ